MSYKSKQKTGKYLTIGIVGLLCLALGSLIDDKYNMINFIKNLKNKK